MRLLLILCVGFLGAGLLTVAALGADIELNGQRFTLPDGLEIDHVAGPPLVDRPVSADFDERGRLYVTDSSGSNQALEVQLEKLPHRIMRLVDTDSDGTFDHSTVFADKVMFPEGAMWYDGSLYVAAPPHIWKFTDQDDDGIADQREIWFDGKTVTHCGNDLHGPYLGPDGWIYWCKGAFAEQTYERPGRSPFTTRAAHIFRRRPEGGPVESVMTGGMDNPVEVVFMPGGERIFTTTFLVHPNQGLRDGLLHAVYGGVYGKNHNVLDGHPRTGDLMPVMTHMGVAAPCGLACLESDGLGSGCRDNLLTCSFNMHKVVRHVLMKDGATFKTEDENLLASDHLDFHPTDVLEDADGSVIVVDTGGWFRLCCPTSQLEKPDVLGGIYRIRRTDAAPADDPRGQQIDWLSLTDQELAAKLSDDRFTVRRQAKLKIRNRGASVVGALNRILVNSRDWRFRLEAVWSLAGIDSPQAGVGVRSALDDPHETVRQAAIHSVSVARDRSAIRQLRNLISGPSTHNRRAAAEALGRIGSSEDVAYLLEAVLRSPGEGGFDRTLDHSLTYAAIELNDADAIRPYLNSNDNRVLRTALIALDQFEGGSQLKADDIQPLLGSDDSLLNDAAWWIAEQHPEWGDAVVQAIQADLHAAMSSDLTRSRLQDRLPRFAGSPAVRQLMADSLDDSRTDDRLRDAMLNAMAASGQKPLPDAWKEPLLKQMAGHPSTVRAALTVYRRLNGVSADGFGVTQLRAIVGGKDMHDADVRLQAMALLPVAQRELSSELLEFLGEQLDLNQSVSNRSLAVDILTTTPLNSEQLRYVARQLPHTGVMELRLLLDLFAQSRDPRVGSVLVESLLKAPAATSLFPDRLTAALFGFGTTVVAEAAPLLAKIEEENRSKVERVESVLALLPQADIRRGLEVFHGSAASCIACHRRSYLGGLIGPDLSRIGDARSERDLLESILFPSLTFVRNYEPTSIVSTDGLVYNGVVREETDSEITLQLDATKTITIPASDVDDRQSGSTSIMPAGLEKQLTPQQLADLVKYLKEG